MSVSNHNINIPPAVAFWLAFCVGAGLVSGAISVVGATIERIGAFMF